MKKIRPDILIILFGLVIFTVALIALSRSSITPPQEQTQDPLITQQNRVFYEETQAYNRALAAKPGFNTLLASQFDQFEEQIQETITSGDAESNGRFYSAEIQVTWRYLNLGIDDDEYPLMSFKLYETLNEDSIEHMEYRYTNSKDQDITQFSFEKQDRYNTAYPMDQTLRTRIPATTIDAIQSTIQAGITACEEKILEERDTEVAFLFNCTYSAVGRGGTLNRTTCNFMPDHIEGTYGNDPYISCEYVPGEEPSLSNVPDR